MVAQDILEKAARHLADQFAPDRIILFGSQARCDADAKSDVDLLVICKPPGKKRELAIAMDRALQGFGFPRDIVILTPEEFERDRKIVGTIARPASLEGRILYDCSG